MTNDITDDNYENELFEELDLDDEYLRGVTFYRCRFVKSSFQFAELVECDFEDCVFENCNLALVKFNNTRLIGSEFRDSKLLGVNWGNAGKVIVVSFINSLLDNSAFSNMNLTKVKFDSCSLVEASFSNTRLARVKFDDCDFQKCQFHQTDLSYADFTSARNYYMNAETNKLHKAKFSLPEAVSLLANLDIVLK